MVKVINEFYNKGIVVVVLGDTHLRTIKTKELGDVSLIQKWAKNKPNVKIIRSQNMEIQ